MEAHIASVHPLRHAKLHSTLLTVCRSFGTGEKLIEHLKKWLDTTKLQETPHSWEPGQESDIAAAILELFHLLPQQASKFLETQGVCSLPSQVTASPHKDNLVLVHLIKLQFCCLSYASPSPAINQNPRKIRKAHKLPVM